MAAQRSDDENMKGRASREYVIWDPLVRCFHWSLAASFFLNYFITEDGGLLHDWIGYFASFALAVRLVWGFIGPRHARFSDFWPSKAGILGHLQDLKRRHVSPSEGHNPVGGLMVLALMTGMVCLGITGYLMKNVDYFFGESWLEELHGAIANGLALLVTVHVSAILVLERWLKMPFIRPMLNGKRTLPNSEDLG